MLSIGKYYWFTIQEEWHLRKLFYSYPPFRCCDLAIKRSYRFQNPYRICKRHLVKKKAVEVHAYGETPITTWRRIAYLSDIRPQDYVIDMGCGRGRAIFFLATVVGCFAHGIDWTPKFIHIATSVQQKYGITRASFSCEDMCSADLTKASVLYLYGTCLDEFSLKRLQASMKRLSSGVRIISVSAPLEGFRILKSFQGTYPWGETDLYLQEI